MERKLKDLGIDLQGKPRSVAHAKWVVALHLAANEMFHGTVMLHHEETVMGKAVIAVMRIMGPRRILSRLNSTLRSGNNYIEATLAPTGPTSWEGSVNECNGAPHYIAGVIEQGLIISGAKNVAILVSDFDGHAAKFHISWA